MTVIVQLTAAGTSTTVFNLFSNINYGLPLVTGITKAQLLAGYSLLAVPDNAITIRVAATGICDNYTDLAISGLTTTSTTSTTSTTTSSTTTEPTTTSTTSTTSTTTQPTTTSSTTSTTTVPFSNVLSLATGYCGDTLIPEYTYYVDQTVQNFTLQDGDIVYEDALFTTPVNGYGAITFIALFNSVKYEFNISTTGEVLGVTPGVQMTSEYDDCPVSTTTTTTTSTTTSSTTAPPSFYTVAFSNSTPISNCSGAGVTTYPITLYVATVPIIVGNTVYSNNTPLANPFVGDGTWYSINSTKSCRINASGEVTEIDDCTQN